MVDDIKTLVTKTVNTYSWSRLKTEVQTPHGPRYYDIPETDFRKLHDFYSENPSSNPNINPLIFVCRVDSRIYAEWCMGEARYNWYSHMDYNGEGFINHVRDETHHELVRRGYKWDEEKKRFEGLSSEQYGVVRDDVLKGFVRHAIEFFEKNEEGWQQLISTEEGRKILEEKKYTTISYDEKRRWEWVPVLCPRNIRASLENYINRAAEVL